MRISEIAVHRIAIADPLLRSSYGLHQPYALRTIIEIKSDDGLTGIAETYGGEAPADALEKLRPRLIGANPFKLTGTLADMVVGKGSGDARSQTMLVPGENPLDATARTYSAVETACLDLIGRATGQPECDLIGGRIKFVEGSVVIPDKPGLGVDHDHDQLARGRERYAKCPYRKRDDTAEMRTHVNPNWERLLPRW